MLQGGAQAGGDGSTVAVIADLESRGLEDERVAPILDVGHDHLGTRTQRILGVGVVGGPGPVAALDVEAETVAGGGVAARPTKVDPPQGGALPICHPGELGAVVADIGRPEQQPAGCLGELHAGADLVTPAGALLLVGVDALGPPSRDVLHPEQVVEAALECGAAEDALVDDGRTFQRVHVATSRAQFRPGGAEWLVGTFGGFADWEDDPVDDVARPLVVHEAARPELADGKEPRTREEVVVAPTAAPACRDEGRER